MITNDDHEAEGVPALWRRAFDKAGQGLAIVGGDGRIRWSSPRLASMFGADGPDLTGADFARLAHPDDDMRADRLRAAFQTGQFTNHTALWSLGAQRLLQPTFTVDARPDGEPITAVMVEDVTTTERLMERTFEAEERLSLTIAASGDGIWDWDLRNDHLCWSDRLIETFGLSPATFKPCSATFFERILPEDRARVEEAVRRHLEEREPYDVRFRVRRSDGRIVPISVRGQASWDKHGRPLRMVGLMEDLTSLERTQKNLRLVEEVAGVGHWRMERSPETIFWSAQVFRIFGLKPDSPSPNLRDAIERYHPDDRQMVSESVALALETGVPFSFRARIIREDGEIRSVRADSEIEIAEDGSPVAIFGTFQDITEQVMQEEHLRQAQKMEAIGRLAGGMAHDFNNVLGVIIANLELLERLPLGDDAERRVAASLAAAEKGAEHTRILLAFSRRRTHQLEEVELGRLLEALTPILAGLAPPSVSLCYVSASEPVYVQVDTSLFDSAVMNLVANARDAMPNGGDIEIRVAVSSETVTLTISDTGVGIPNELLKRVREPFFTTKTNSGGTGLGLSMVENFAAESGALFDLENRAEGGARARLTFRRRAVTPRVVADDPAIVATTAYKPRQGLTRLKGLVVLVEDNAALRDVLAQELRAAGARVEAFATGEAALMLIAHRGLDLLISDIDLSGAMSGVELAQQVEKRQASVPIILISGHPDERAAAETALKGRVAWLAKPFRTAHLLRLASAIMTSADPQGPASRRAVSINR